MKLVADKSFKRAFKKITKKNPQLQSKILEVLDLLECDPFTPSLKSHKLTGNLDGYWSCSVAYDCRVVFAIKQDEYAEESLIVLVDIGTHDEVY
jgi:addiction module RelE/StbE family toxin